MGGGTLRPAKVFIGPTRSSSSLDCFCIVPSILGPNLGGVGTALLAGAGGTALFGVLGLVASVPMLIKLRRRFSSWWAPAVALGVFTSMFLFSSFVVGPLISAPDAPTTPGVFQVDHDAHHS